MMLVNLFAGPGAGKSTIAAKVFVMLKEAMIPCELVTEYAKDLCWEGRTPNNQIHVLGEQHQRFHRLKDKVEVIVTDSPLLLVALYGRFLGMSNTFENLVREEHQKLDPLNFYLLRLKKPYDPNGRWQDEQEAKKLDKQIWYMLQDYGVPFMSLPGDSSAAGSIFEEIKRVRRVQQERDAGV